ncbi:MAG: GNAT family N-acetyltransferase [Acidobacteria bacterium ACB2]|nr:GNAT family N-acetyltransferase [Acidobacteria bacterium ACB2]
MPAPGPPERQRDVRRRPRRRRGRPDRLRTAPLRRGPGRAGVRGGAGRPDGQPEAEDVALGRPLAAVPSRGGRGRLDGRPPRPPVGDGLGARLLKRGFALAHHEGFSVVDVAVDESNRPAIDLYCRVGFRTGVLREAWARVLSGRVEG